MGNIDKVDLPSEAHLDMPLDMVAAARKTVAANSTDATECATLLEMLGLHPSQETETMYDSEPSMFFTSPRSI